VNRRQAIRPNRLQKGALFCHSERSEESLLDLSARKEREILRFAQNDKRRRPVIRRHSNVFARHFVVEMMDLKFGGRDGDRTCGLPDVIGTPSLLRRELPKLKIWWT